MAQLYYGNAHATEGALVSVSEAPVPFRATASIGPGGVWVTLTPIRVLEGIPIGATANLQVRVWDITKFVTFEASVAGGGYYSRSAIFGYIVPRPGSPPDAYYMDNMRSYAMVPEPSAFALSVIGMGSLIFLYRRK